VRVSSRLTDSMACLVGDEYDMSPQLARMLRAMDQKMAPAKRILEINPDHPVLAKLLHVYEHDAKEPVVGTVCAALVRFGAVGGRRLPPDPGQFSKLVADLMADKPECGVASLCFPHISR